MKADTMNALPAARASRLAFVDNLRWLVIAMVVVIHACVTYSGFGSWFYIEKNRLDVASWILLGGYESFSQAFFMGFMFFIAGIFVPKAYDKKGFGRFVTDRAIRLGIPTAVFMFILNPLIEIIRRLFSGRTFAGGASAGEYARYVASPDFISGTGPLWFTLALLVFSVFYGLARLIGLGGGFPASPARGRIPPTRALSHGPVAAVIALIALCTFLVRLVQPIGTSWYNMQLCNFSQYIVMFTLGLWIGRNDLLHSIPAGLGTTWLKLAVAAGVPAWFLLMGFGGAFSAERMQLFYGGWHWQSAAYAVWESFFAVAFSLGLLVLFRERVNARTPLFGFLSDNCFGVYVFHAPILVAISMAIKEVKMYPLVKTALAAAAALTVAYIFAALVRKVPGLRRLFS